MKKRIVSLLLAAVMVVSMAACGQKAETGQSGGSADSTMQTGNEAEVSDKEEAPQEVITLTAFFKTELPWDTAVAEEITRRTGVKLEFVPVAGDAAEKLNLMMISDQVPDIVTIDRGAAANEQYITNGKVIPLDELIEQYGPNVKAQLGETMDKVRNVSDGKLYGIPGWFQNEIAPSPVFGFNIRMKYVKELGYYDKYIEKGYFTQDEFLSLLKEWKEKYPTIDGKESIAMAFNSENDGDYTWPFRGMYGIKSSYEKDGELYDEIRNPKTKEMYLFMNQLYREGLIDKDWPVTKETLYNEKIANGYVLSSPAAYWNIKNDQLKIDAEGNVDIDNQMFPFLVTAPDVKPEETTYGPTSVLGWSNTYISSTNKNPEKTMEFFNFLMSEEGQYLTQWGVEGVHWEMKDGKRVVLQPVADQIEAGTQWDYFKKEGIRLYEMLFKGGNGVDGQAYDVNTEYANVNDKVDEVTLFAREYLGETAYDTTAYDNLEPDAGTPEALIATKISDLKKEAFPKVILAGSAEEAAAAYDKLLEDAETAGLAQLEKIKNDKFKVRMEIWGQ